MLMSVPYQGATRPCKPGEKPGLVELRRYVLARWGGQNLGIYACRNVRGGTAPSLHSEGRAFDWRAPSRTALDQAMGFLIANADRLNIQRIHDYQKQRNWDTRYGRWRYGGVGSGAGGPTWHVERNWTGANDRRPIDQILAGSPSPAPVPIPVPPASTVPTPIASSEEEDVFSFEQPLRPNEAPRDPLRPQKAKVSLSGQFIMCIGGSSVAGDSAQNVFGVPCRIFDLKPRTGGAALFDADELPGAYGVGGIRVTDVFGRAHVIPWS